EKFDIEWTDREITPSERFTIVEKEYVPFEEEVVVTQVVEESQVEEIQREQEAPVEDETVTTETTTTVTTTEQEVPVTDGEEITKVITTVRETGVIAQPVVSKGTSWFRRLASGAGAAIDGGLKQVDGVWKRSIQVLTTRKAHVNEFFPYASTSFVYYDDDVYDSTLVEKNSGLTHHMQLLYDSKSKAYYVFNHWGEKEYDVDGPHSTIEAAKAAFLAIFTKWYGLEWSKRETAVSDRWSYQVQTYKTFEETEVVEENVDDYEVSKVVAKDQQVIADERVISSQQSIISSHDDTVARSVSEKIVTQEGGPVSKQVTRTQYEAVTRTEGGSSGAGQGSGSSSTTETKKTVIDFASLPTLGDVGIDPNTGARLDIGYRSSTVEVLQETPNARPRAWVSLHVGGWQDAPHELEGFMRLDDQSGQRLMENARDAASGKAQEATAIDNLRLPEIVALFARKLYGHFGEELPEELSLERLSTLGPHRQ
ncbi:hypothetical protein BGZ49_003176, partial [Haplosporangium sp. Z 27]